MHRFFTSALLFTMIVSIPLYSQDWTALHKTLIKFYSYQRSGLKPTATNSTGNPYNLFYNKTADDGKYPHSNDAIDGGWYDAGDFVKFGLPQGYVTYCLLKGYDVWPSSYDDLDSWDHKGSKDNIPDILNEAKVGTDYLIKAVISSGSVVLDVGNGNDDHKELTESGYANSNRLNNRPVYKTADGADAPGYYAAALALMSMLYKPHDAAYAATCLQKAKDAYTFGKNHPKVCTQQICSSTGNKPFYETQSWAWADKLACAAIELYRATKEASYLTEAEGYMAKSKTHSDVVSTQYGGDFAAFEFYRLGKSGGLTSGWVSDIGTAMGRVVKGNTLVSGASVNTWDWGVCKTAANAGFSAALLYMVTGDKSYKDFAIQQIKWVAGISPYSKSYIVRYGTGAPQSPHHRNDVALGSVTRLVGGIVSGPTAPQGQGTDKSTWNWTYSDAKENFKNSEVAIDYNAGAVGAVAFIRHYFSTADIVRIEDPIIAKPNPVNFNTATSVAITASFNKSTPWKLTLQGETSKAVKTYSGTGTSVSVSWTADADASGGAFMSQENVIMKLDVDKLWDIQKATKAQGSFFLQSLKTEPFKPTDKEVDNFEDATIDKNLIGGKWIAFSDVADKVPGGASVASALYSDAGSGNTKGLIFRLMRNAGATCPSGPYSGVKTTITPGGGTANIGPIKSVVFDVYPWSDTSKFWVEFEQSDITDKAYHGAKVSLAKGGSWTRVRIALDKFAQPSWKTAAVPLNLQKISAIRFVGYGVGNERYTIDNMRVEDMNVGTAPQLSGQSAFSGEKGLFIVKANSSLLSYRFFFPGHERNAMTATIFNGAGKCLHSRCFGGAAAGSLVTEQGLSLAPGIYFLKVVPENTRQSVLGTFIVER